MPTPYIEDIKEALREVVREVLEEYLKEDRAIEVKQNHPNRCWYPTKEAYKLLDLKSSRQLLEMRCRLKLGDHYRYSNRTKKFNRPTYDWHVPNCKKALAQNPLRR